mmetsp:Transcript_51107/g.95218  ORF Transcript_51107/g.95218 Transcript_51107/m.95218 type:complete len:80 (+) Transcript_51107:59-298(+)
MSEWTHKANIGIIHVLNIVTRDSRVFFCFLRHAPQWVDRLLFLQYCVPALYVLLDSMGSLLADSKFTSSCNFIQAVCSY